MFKTCAFFGHREVNSDIVKSLEAAVRSAVTIYGITEFWCGSQGAFDLYAAAAVHCVKQDFPYVKLILYPAYPRPQKLIPLEYIDSSIYLEKLKNVFPKYAISKRNQWLAQNCDMVIAYVNQNNGGAYKAYACAEQHGKLIWNLGSLHK